jgi:hypothetical protein
LCADHRAAGATEQAAEWEIVILFREPRLAAVFERGLHFFEKLLRDNRLVFAFKDFAVPIHDAAIQPIGEKRIYLRIRPAFFLLLGDDAELSEPVTSVWWLNQNGLPNVAGVMGADCSERQAELIVSAVKPAGRVWLMPDGNEAGERCAQSVLRQVSPYRFTRWAKLTDDKQPTDLSAEQLKNSFIL